MHFDILKYLCKSIFLTSLFLFAVTGWSGDWGKPKQLVVFGDSVSDPGNFYALTNLASRAPYDLIPSAPYVIGGMHFSNGKTWVEQLADHLDLAAGAAYRDARFTNYAVGGARARPAGFMDLSTQVADWLASQRAVSANDTLYIVVIGGNDVRDAIESLAVDPTGAAATQILTAAVTGISDNLQALVASGAQKFLIATIGDLAMLPAIRYLGPQVQGAAHILSLQYNLALSNMLRQLQVALPIQLTTLDLYQLINAIIASPAAYGIRVIDKPCLTPGVIANAVCDKPDKYLFWDGIHPTRKGHALIAGYAKTVLRAISVARPSPGVASPTVAQ